MLVIGCLRTQTKLYFEPWIIFSLELICSIHPRPSILSYNTKLGSKLVKVKNSE